MIIRLNWEGRSYTNDRFARDLAEVKKAIPGRFYFTTADTAGLITDDFTDWTGYTDLIVKELCVSWGTGVVEEFDPSCVKWTQYGSIEEFLRDIDADVDEVLNLLEQMS